MLLSNNIGTKKLYRVRWSYEQSAGECDPCLLNYSIFSFQAASCCRVVILCQEFKIHAPDATSKLCKICTVTDTARNKENSWLVVLPLLLAVTSKILPAADA